jgi:hypothetical protein
LEPQVVRFIKYYWGDQVKEDEMRRHVTRVGEIRNAYKIFVGKPEGKRPLGKPRRRWKNNNRMNLRERRWESVDWIHLAENRDQWRAVVNTVMNLRLP